jgi:hypothetical protein
MTSVTERMFPTLSFELSLHATSYSCHSSATNWIGIVRWWVHYSKPSSLMELDCVVRTMRLCWKTIDESFHVKL